MKREAHFMPASSPPAKQRRGQNDGKAQILRTWTPSRKAVRNRGRKKLITDSLPREAGRDNGAEEAYPKYRQLLPNSVGAGQEDSLVIDSRALLCLCAYSGRSNRNLQTGN